MAENKQKSEECYLRGKPITLEEYSRNQGCCDECALAFGTYTENVEDARARARV